jgi:hypothetical protein
MDFRKVEDMTIEAIDIKRAISVCEEGERKIRQEVKRFPLYEMATIKVYTLSGLDLLMSWVGSL